MSSILKVDTIQDQSGNNIINENADTITIGASGDTVNIVGTLQNNGSGLVSGITVADQWRLTSDLSLSSGVETTITTNLEQVDTAGQGTIGTVMSQSSGIFTFPSTGVYLVCFTVSGNINADTRYIQARINVTTNNSTYNPVAINSSFNQQSSGSDSDSNSVTQSLIDVTDTANVKVKFSILSANNATASGNSTYNYTHMTFIRLGDT
jgi:hypothetical protein